MSLPTDWNAVRKALRSYLATAPEFPRRFAEARSRLVTLNNPSPGSPVGSGIRIFTPNEVTDYELFNWKRFAIAGRRI
jgi:hypothetical protein